MAIDTHIKFAGIEGESTSADHKGEVEVLSWHWGLTHPGPATGGGSGVGKAQPEQLRVVHGYDKASPRLARSAARGEVIRTAVLTARKAGEGQKDFLKITMKEVFITSVQTSSQADGSFTEEVAMAYGAINFAYQPSDDKGGLGTAVKFDWNLKTGNVS